MLPAFDDPEATFYVFSGRLALQLRILTLSAVTEVLLPSILNVTFLIKKVQTSSQNRYVSSEPYR